MVINAVSSSNLPYKIKSLSILVLTIKIIWQVCLYITCVFSQGYAPFIDVENSLKTILDNIEHQTGKPDIQQKYFLSFNNVDE